MSFLLDDPTTPLVSGAFVIREISALGVRGDALPLGVSNRSYLYDCADLPADNAVEFRGEVLSHDFPPGIFFAYDDGSFSVDPTCPDGIYSFTFRLYADGVAQTPLVTNQVIVGASGQLAITASMGSFLSIIPIVGDIAGVVPANLSLTRQYRVNPDVHLDAYSITQGFALSWAKDPDASLDYSINWSDWLADVPGDSIANMYASNSAGLQVVGQALRGAVTAVQVNGGVVGVMESVTIRVATALGRIDERTIKLLIREH